jgi:hypothetical protein
MQSSHAFAFPSDSSKTRPRQSCRASDAGNAVSHVAPMRSLVKVLRWS